MTEPSVVRKRRVAVVLDADRRRVFLVRSDEGWTLPSWDVEPDAGWIDVGPLDEALRSRFALDAVTLRPLHAADASGDDLIAHELEPRDPWWEPPAGARWGEPGEIDEPALRALAVFDGSDDPQRQPWTDASWYVEAEAWIDARLLELGRPRTGRIRQMRTWSISSVMTAPTAAGDVWFKAVPPIFACEPALTLELATRHPWRTTPVLAIDVEQRRLLTDDLGGTELHEIEDPEVWEVAVRAYAALQRSWLGHVDRLLELGCADRRLDKLTSELGPTLADPLLAELPDALSPAERAALPALRERLGGAIDRLRALDVPQTLDHGDFHPGNVRIGPDGPVFFDWTDGCVAPAPFSLVPFLERDPFAANRLRDTYLAAWDSLVSLEAYELSRFVAHFHLALSYRWIAHSTERRQRWELTRWFPELVRILLRWESPGA